MADFLCKTPRAVGLALFTCTVVILNGDPVKHMLRREHVKETMPGGGRGIGGGGMQKVCRNSANVMLCRCCLCLWTAIRISHGKSRDIMKYMTQNTLSYIPMQIACRIVLVRVLTGVSFK